MGVIFSSRPDLIGRLCLTETPGGALIAGDKIRGLWWSLQEASWLVISLTGRPFDSSLYSPGDVWLVASSGGLGDSTGPFLSSCKVVLCEVAAEKFYMNNELNRLLYCKALFLVWFLIFFSFTGKQKLNAKKNNITVIFCLVCLSQNNISKCIFFYILYDL